LPAGAGVDDRLGDRFGLGEDPAGGRLGLQLRGWEALGRHEPGEHHTHVNAVRGLLGVECVGPTDERELARRVGARVGPGHARRAVLATFTMLTWRAVSFAAVARSSGSSASVSRTGASKLSFM